MKLRVEKGMGAGRVFELESALITIGRAADNDIVLNDEMVSQHHAKVWRDLDGKISVTDMDSVNGTEVNGRQIQTTELRTGDRLLVGKTVMRLLEDGASSTAAPAAAAPAAAEHSVPEERPSEARKSVAATIDLGFDERPRRESQREGQGEKQPLSPSIFLSKKVLIVLGGALLAVVGALLFKSISSGPKEIEVKQQGKEPSAVQSLEIYYEYVIGTTIDPANPKLRRYAVRLKDNKLFVELDDLTERQNETQKAREEKTLSAASLKKLLDSLNLEALEKLDRREFTGTPDPRTRLQIDFRVTTGADYMRFLVRNTMEPDALKYTRQALETFVGNETTINNIPPEEKLRIAREAYELATRYDIEQEVARDNLHKAIKLYARVLENLKTIEPKPPLYDEAKKKLIIAQQNLEKKVSDLLSAAKVLIQLGEWPGAEERLREILQRLENDESDPLYDEPYKLLIGKVLPNLNKRR